MRVAAIVASILATLGLLVKGDTVLDSVRARAVDLLNRYVPSGPDDERFREIIKDYGGKGTTCGYLTPWLLYRLGLRNPRLINRSEPDQGLSYKPGANISIIRWQPEFRVYGVGTLSLPKPGDTFFISEGPPESEHVGILLQIRDDGVWVCAEAGQRDAQGKQCSRVVERRLVDGRLARIDGKSAPKPLVGWLDLGAAMTSGSHYV